MKIAAHITLPVVRIKKGSQVIVIDNKDADWHGIGGFEDFDDSVGKIYTVKSIDWRSHNEVSVYLSNDYWYPISTLEVLS